MRSLLLCLLLIGFLQISYSQLVIDDFEGNSTIAEWIGDDCQVNEPFPNPLVNSFNSSENVLRYHDTGGAYANIRFDHVPNFILTEESVFTFKIYVPSSGITGNQPNQVSLKLQSNNVGAPWTTQCEIIKQIVLDQWQEVSFDFANDPYININPGLADPLTRGDFNRAVIQVNGEDNNDHVLAYIDDFHFEGGTPEETNDPIYDELVWADEFDADGAIDDTKWFHQTILPNGDSWFNGEIQHYTNRLENSSVSNGILSIVARRENFTDQGVTKQFTSARLNSKFAFTYGRVEVRAKLPTGIGTWPAIWMLGKNIEEVGTYWDIEGYGTAPWPACGEIDIMEHWGNNQNFVQSAMHTPSSFGGTVNHGGQVIPTASTDFHTYALDWYPDRMVFSVDDQVHYVYKPEVQNESTWPFDKEQFILLNIAIEPSIQPSFMKSSMDIAYVRIYQEKSLSKTSLLLKEDLQIAPNPVSNILNIKIPEGQQASVVDIYNIHGVPMNRFLVTGSNLSIDTNQWLPGIYLINWTGSQGSKTYKVIKQ